MTGGKVIPRRLITIGSRGSLLALRQTQQVAGQLALLYPQYHFAVKRIKTRGDKAEHLTLSQLKGKGLFVKELEIALLGGDIDLAVHSLKDLPLQLSPGLEVAAISQREDTRDVLVSRGDKPLADLTEGALLGTSSPRRIAQIKAFRSDLVIGDIRGNIETRLNKVSRGEFDGVILAACGLLRLGWEDRISQYLSGDICLPQVGQGALAIEVRQEDEEIKQIVLPLDHRPTRQATTAERALLHFLGGGCHIPIAALGQVCDNTLKLTGVVGSLSGEKLLRAELDGDVATPEKVGILLAQKLIAQGAREILAEATRC